MQRVLFLNILGFFSNFWKDGKNYLHVFGQILVLKYSVAI